MEYLANAFSLQMLRDPDAVIISTPLTEEEFKKLSYDAYSIIGHQDLANILGVEYNRESIKLNPGDIVYVAQVTGGRFPEGATEIPSDRRIDYLCVRVFDKKR